MSDMKKYIILAGNTLPELEDKVNLFSDDYGLREICINDDWFYASMSLREDNKYDNIEKYKKLEITYEEQTIPAGWQVIHHTSKELIVVKKYEQNTGTDEQVGVAE